MSLSDVDRRVLWVRAGGRCTLCKSYLLEGELVPVEEPLGEGAHIVGRIDSEKSPRGKDDLPVAERDTVDNIMLACSRCHTEIDKQRTAQILDTDFLRQKKRDHEAEIKHQTGLTTDRRTAVLRMAGDIRGDVMELPRDAATQAVLQSAGRFPMFLESYDRQGVEIDLRQLPGEHPLEESYYAAACTKINAALANRVRPGVENGDITHLSVFAIARLPLLVYLGSKLDDGHPIDIYQRHRATEAWRWPVAGTTTTFELTSPPAEEAATEGVLITNLSGTTPVTDLPAPQQVLPTWVLRPANGPGEDAISSSEALANFTTTLRALFTDMEATHKQMQVLHLFGALPLSGAVALGRSLKSDGLRPAVITYDRSGDGYRRALEV